MRYTIGQLAEIIDGDRGKTILNRTNFILKDIACS